jgi:hypothetical protein
MARPGECTVILPDFSGETKLVVDGSAGGSNRATLTDTAGDDTLTASGNSLTLASSKQTLQLSGFGTVSATATQGQNRKKVSATSFKLNLLGNWTSAG